MEDTAIIELYFARSERAIVETDSKYGKYCYTIAYNILRCREDSEESVNDTYLAAWDIIPPKQPSILATFLGKLTRCISLDRWKYHSAGKRGGGQVALALEELDETVAGSDDVEKLIERKELTRCINQFLETLPEAERKVFVCRYWYLEPVQDIAQRFDFAPGKVTSMLHRTREKLRKYLSKEGLL